MPPRRSCSNSGSWDLGGIAELLQRLVIQPELRQPAVLLAHALLPVGMALAVQDREGLLPELAEGAQAAPAKGGPVALADALLGGGFGPAQALGVEGAGHAAHLRAA